MKITHIISETTTSGSVATVAAPLFKQSRKGGNLLTGTKTKKKYANSLSEGKMKELAMDLKSGKDGLTDEEFKKKYNKTKEEMRKSLESKPEQVKEAELQEDDLILVPGQGRKFKTGFVPHAKDRTDHEVEMALSDLFQAAKNAKEVYQIVKTYSEEEGLEGWVQEKIIKANDYLNTIREYLEHRQLTKEGTLGAVAGGVAGAVIGKSPSAAMTGAELGSALQDKFTGESGAGVIAGGPQYEGMAEGAGKRCMQCGMKNCKCPSGSCKCKPVAGWIPGKGFQKAIEEATKQTMSRAAKGNEKYGKQGMQALAKAGREGKDLDKVRDKYNKYDEGAKVDRMVKHIEKSEEKAGKSKKEAENIAWATVNKKGMLNNKNKKLSK